MISTFGLYGPSNGYQKQAAAVRRTHVRCACPTLRSRFDYESRASKTDRTWGMSAPDSASTNRAIFFRDSQVWGAVRPGEVSNCDVRTRTPVLLCQPFPLCTSAEIGEWRVSTWRG